MGKILNFFTLNKQNLLTACFLFVILLFAVVTRFYNLSAVPSGFHIDEAIIADNAYSIMQTGKDTDNNFLPLQTEQFGDFNPTGYAYLAIIPIKILGLTIFAARSVGAALSVLTVLGVFLLTYSIFERKNQMKPVRATQTWMALGLKLASNRAKTRWVCAASIAVVHPVA